MKKLLLLAAAASLAASLLGAATAGATGPPGGTIYANDQAFKTVVAAKSLPDRGSADILYVFPDCAECAAVSDAAPGQPGYNGGRWRVVEAYGITAQLTNAGAVQAAATSLVDTGNRFSCPLIKG
jgi:hypothetical protein